MAKWIRRYLTAPVLMLAMALPAAAQDGVRDWSALASSLEPGTRIEVDLTDGTHMEGTVLAQEGDVFVFNPKTRRPVTPWRIAHSEIRAIELKRGSDGLKPGAKVLLGIGVGAGVILLFGALVAATAD